jgi:protein SCO1
MNYKTQNVSALSSKMGLRNLLAKAFLPPPTQGRGGNQFPDAVVTSHNGKAFRFYSDLIRDKVVMVHFMTLDSQQHFPSLAHLSQLARQLGDELGENVSLYSITTDPIRDTPERLAAYAEEHGIPAGWYLIRPSEGDVKTLSSRFARHLPQHQPKEGFDLRMVHCGNAKAGIWSAFAADADPSKSVIRVSGLYGGGRTNGELRRAGPVLLSEQHSDKTSNRDV